MKYIGFFDAEINSSEKRNSHMSSHNKMLYISSVLNELEEKVEIISPSWTLRKKFFKNKEIKINNNLKLILFPTIPYIKGVSQIFSLSCLFLYLLFNTNKGETILVYHSLPLIPIIQAVRRLKSLNVILEVEEVYSSVIKNKKKYNEYERKYIKKMDKRILVSQKLKDTIGQKNDLVLYGSYTVRNIEEVKSDSTKLVYAGTIDKLKGGVFNAIEAMQFIPTDQIKLYILGIGGEASLKHMRERIKSINKSKGYEAIKYLGKKEGKEFDRLMSGYGIGLNLQNLGSYMDSAFPSKILTYFSYDLKVISTKVDSIYNSVFSEHISFVDNKDLKEFATLIEEMVFESENKINTKDLIVKYHNQFKIELKETINELKLNM